MTGPAEEPVSLDEAKAHLKVEYDSEDFLIASQIAAARLWAEKFTNRAFITQTWRMRFPVFPGALPINLYPSPLQSIVSLIYIDNSGVEQTWGSGNYVLHADGSPGGISLSYGGAWPSVRSQYDAITITYIVGYGTAAQVPDDIKAAILLRVGDLFANREATIIGVSAADNPTVCALLEPYKLRYLR